MFPQFTQLAVLETIGHRSLARFFDGFSDDLRAANVPWPIPPGPDAPTSASENGNYFKSIAAVLASPDLLPERLRAALVTLEKAASPENRDLLNDTLSRRFPCVSLN